MPFRGYSLTLAWNKLYYGHQWSVSCQTKDIFHSSSWLTGSCIQCGWLLSSLESLVMLLSSFFFFFIIILIFFLFFSVYSYFGHIIKFVGCTKMQSLVLYFFMFYSYMILPNTMALTVYIDDPWGIISNSSLLKPQMYTKHLNLNGRGIWNPTFLKHSSGFHTP